MDNCNGKDLQTGQTCTLSIVFKPQGTGERTIDIYFQTGRDGSIAPTKLVGTGVP